MNSEKAAVKTEIRKGDIVVLKSSSPMLTVADASDSSAIHCVWYSSTRGHFESCSYPQECFKTYDPDPR